MGEKEKVVLLEWTGVIGTVILIAFDRLSSKALCISFFMVFIAFGIGVATKLLINQYTEDKQYRLIHCLSINYVFKLFTLIFYSYFKMNAVNHGVHQHDIIRFILLFLVVQCIETLIIGVMPRYELSTKKILMGLLGIGILNVIVCRIMPIGYMIRICQTLNVLNIIMYSFIFFKWKGWVGERLGNQWMYSKLFVLVGMIQCFLGIIIPGFYSTHHMTYIGLNLVQGIYLLVYTYTSCLREPWNQKLNDLNEANYIIHKQSEACDLIVGLSHELKTPVNIIRSALDMMVLDCEENGEILGEVQEIRKDCIEMMNIIQNMIDVQRIKGHHVQVNDQIYNLVEVIENVIDAFSRNMRNSLILFNPEEEEIYQELDLKLIQQAFMIGGYLLMKQDSQSEIYIEIGRLQETQETYIGIKHNALYQLKKAYCPISQKLKEDNSIAIGLTLQVISLIFQIHKVRIEYVEENETTVMKMIWPPCCKTTEKWLNEENIIGLGEQMRARGMVS